MSDETVDALGELSAALETVEHARGHLYAFPRLSGTADLALQDAVEHLRSAGHGELADEIDTVLVGRDVIDGKWTFQLVEDYDAGYWSVFRAVERIARERVGDGARERVGDGARERVGEGARQRRGEVEPHVYEAELKRSEQS